MEKGFVSPFSLGKGSGLQRIQVSFMFPPSQQECYLLHRCGSSCGPPPPSVARALGHVGSN